VYILTHQEGEEQKCCAAKKRPHWHCQHNPPCAIRTKQTDAVSHLEHQWRMANVHVQKPPTCLGFDDSQGYDYTLEPDLGPSSTDTSSISFTAPFNNNKTADFYSSALIIIVTGRHAYSAAAKKSDPDTLTWDQALSDTNNQAAYFVAAKLELHALTK
jgi:hypothetical protein